MILDEKAASTADKTATQPGPSLAGGAHRLSGRALVGGLLIALATVGALLLSGAKEESLVPVVVATEVIEAGTPLGPDLLETVEMALPEALINNTFGQVDVLHGTVARSHLEPGDLIQRGSIITATAAQRLAAPAREISLRLESDRVVDGNLENGDRIDVLATYGTGASAYTVVVLSDAAVLSVRALDSSLGSSRTVVLTLALPSRADTVALAHAVDVANVTIVRTTTAEVDASELHPFQPSANAIETPNGSAAP